MRCIVCKAHIEAEGFVKHVNRKCFEGYTLESAHRQGLVKCACGELHSKTGTTRHRKQPACVAARAAAKEAEHKNYQAQDGADGIYFVEENDDEGGEDRENNNAPRQAVPPAPPAAYPFARKLYPEDLAHVAYLSDEDCKKFVENDSGDPDTLRYFLLLHQIKAPDKLTNKRIRRIVSDAANNLSKKYLETSDRSQMEELLFRILCLPKLGWARKAADAKTRCNIVMTGDVRSRLLCLADKSSKSRVPSRAAGDVTLDLGLNEINMVRKFTSEGSIRKAGQVVASPPAIAPMTADVVNAMIAKHPTGTTNPCGDGSGPLPPRLREEELGMMLDTLSQELDPQTAAGIDGMDTYVLKSFLDRGNDRLPPYFRSLVIKHALTAYNNTAPGGAMLRASRMTPIQQGEKARPIACGLMVERMVSKMILRGTPYAEALLPYQLGVGKPGGVEPALVMAQRAYQDQLGKQPIPIVEDDDTDDVDTDDENDNAGNNDPGNDQDDEQAHVLSDDPRLIPTHGKATLSAAASAVDARVHQPTHQVREDELDDNGDPHRSTPDSTRESRRIAKSGSNHDQVVAAEKPFMRPFLARKAKSNPGGGDQKVSDNVEDPDCSEDRHFTMDRDESPGSSVSDNVPTPPSPDKVHDKVPDKFVVLVDIKNAFNSASRKATARAISQWCPAYYRFFKYGYNTPSVLIMGYGDETRYLSSSEGFRQGDPCGPLYFSVLFRTVLPEVIADTEAELQSAYLDDVWLVTKNPNVLDVLKNAFPAEGSPTGLVVHEGKTQVISLNDMVAGKIGCEMLGSFVGSLELRRDFLNKKINALNLSLSRLRSLPFHHQYIILRDSISRKLLHLLRCLDTTGLEPELEQLDRNLWQVLHEIQGIDLDPDLDHWKIAALYHLPRTFGGLGVTSHAHIRDAARTACTTHALQQIQAIYPDDRRFDDAPPNAPPTFADDRATAIPNMGPPKQKELVHKVNKILLARMFDESECSGASATALADNSSKTGTAWQQALPHGQHRFLSNQHMREIIRARAQLHPTWNSATCAGCGLTQTHGHEDSCQYHPGRTSIKTGGHDYIRDITHEMCRDGDRVAVIEPVLAVGTPNRNAVQQNNIHRRADLKINMANSTALDPTYPYIDIKISAVITTHTEKIAKNAYEDPLPLDPTKTDKHPENLRRGWNAIAKVLENTVNKTDTHYAKLNLDHPVVPIVISAGGTLHKTAHKFLKHLGMGQGNLYKNTIIDISVALARRRAELRLGCQA